jgi:hypothetical protein
MQDPCRTEMPIPEITLLSSKLLATRTTFHMRRFPEKDGYATSSLSASYWTYSRPGILGFLGAAAIASLGRLSVKTLSPGFRICASNTYLCRVL